MTMRWKSLLAAVVAAMAVDAPATARAQSAVMAVDAYNRKVHVARAGAQKRPVGGLAKIVTTMVTLDWAEASRVGVNVLATVPDYATRIAGAASPDLQPGDRVTIRDLVYATMMTSDNVAAITLGHFVGNDLLQRMGRGGDPLEQFVKEMNSLAQREGAAGTRFMNPHGFENTRPMGGSTAADIARVALYAASRPSFRFYTNPTGAASSSAIAWWSSCSARRIRSARRARFCSRAGAPTINGSRPAGP